MNGIPERAIKTFLEAAGAVIIATLTPLTSAEAGGAAWKQAAATIFIGALAAGLSAMWNGVISPWLKKGSQPSEPSEKE